MAQDIRRKIYTLQDYLDPEQLPVWVDHVPLRTHPERRFHSHRFLEIVFVRSGPALHLLEDQSVQIDRFDVLLIPPGLVHAYDRCDQLELLNLVFDDTKLPLPILDAHHLPFFARLFPSQDKNANRNTADPVMTLPETVFEPLWQEIMLLKREIAEIQPGCRFVSLALFMKIIGTLARQKNIFSEEHTQSVSLSRVIEYMHSHLAEPLTVHMLAQYARMSDRNFYRHFKNATGSSPLQYLLSLRLSRAAHLLQGGVPRKEIAASCGFCDANYLARMLRLHHIC